MKSTRITQENLTMVYGHVKKYLRLMTGLLDVIVLENVYTFKNALRLSKSAYSIQSPNNVKIDYYGGSEPFGITIVDPLELDIPEKWITIGDQIWVTSQGIFIKSWMAFTDDYKFIVIKGVRGLVELLVYSPEQLSIGAEITASRGEDMMDISYYKNKRFTDRTIKGPFNFNDAKVIYKGVVDPIHISVKKEPINVFQREFDIDDEEMLRSDIWKI